MYPISEELAEYRDDIRAWVSREIPKDWVRDLERCDNEFPYNLWDKYTERGLHGIGIPEDYGGKGGGIFHKIITARELARTAAGMMWIWGVTSFAATSSIGLYGSPEQKRTFLPKLAAGEIIAGFGFTEPGGGTDVLGNLETKATACPGGWIVNGRKKWLSFAQVADYILLLVRTNNNVEKKHQGVSLLWVPAQQEGVVATPVKRLGQRAMPVADVEFKEVFVPADHMIGDADHAWKMLTPTLNIERLMVAALCLGCMDGVLEDAIVYMKERYAFGRPIGQFQALQHYLAEIATLRYGTELMIYNCADMMNSGNVCHIEANMAKMYASESIGKAADLGIQIMGGMGYSAETDMQRYWRDTRMPRFAPISNEMCRNSIAESLGMPRSY